MLLGGMPIHCMSEKPDLTAISTCESEIEASLVGLRLGLALKALIEEALQQAVKTVLVGDNQAAIRSITTQMTRWRSRHYASRAGWIRDHIGRNGIALEHRRGTLLVSDALTKVLDRRKLTEARLRLGLQVQTN